jgi:hypothetical protein
LNWRKKKFNHYNNRMITRNFLAGCFLFFLYITCNAQTPDYFPSISESDIPEALFKTPRTYTGTSLFGYINGGAELYLEYGFSGAWVNEIQFMGGNYTVEIYRMNGPEEAFGIFSISRFQCRSTPPMTLFACHTPYQLQLCTGSFYISIINSSGNRTDSITSLKIGEFIVNKIKEKPAQLGNYLPGVPPETINRHAILVKGQLGIMNSVPGLSEYFGELSGYTAVILIDGEQSMLSVRFEDKEKLGAFATLHSLDPEKLSAGSAILPSGNTISKISENHLMIVMLSEVKAQEDP